MNAILTYIVGIVACSGVFVLFYIAVMHRHIRFRTARVFLLASLVVSAVIPVFDIPVWRSEPVEMMPAFVMPEIPMTAVVTEAPPKDLLPIALWSIYGLGISILVAAIVRQIVKIARIRRRADIHRNGEFCVAVSDEVSAPFSFLGTVFVERGMQSEIISKIMLHESSHIRHRHSMEKIAMEVLKSVMWFNPFAWWASRLLDEVHEFEADRDVLDGGFPVEDYLPLIFSQIFGVIPEVSVGLGNSLTKKRFLMMKNKMKQTKFSWLRTAGVLPLVAGMMMLFGFTHRVPEIITTPEAASSTIETSVPEAASMVTPEVVGTGTPKAALAAVETSAPAPAPAPASAETTATDNPEPNIDEITIVGSGTQKKFAIGVVHGDNLANIPDSEQPMIIFDGREISVEELEKLDANIIENITVLKDGAAVEAHGVNVKNGVILVTSKKEGEITIVGSGTMKKADAAEIGLSGVSGVRVARIEDLPDSEQPVIIFDGREISFEESQKLDPNKIERITVLKDGAAVEAYGENAKNGAIIITSKKPGDSAGE